MLAHKAVPQGKIAAEVIAGEKHFFEPNCIAGAYTDPSGWVGVTENEAKKKASNMAKATSLGLPASVRSVTAAMKA